MDDYIPGQRWVNHAELQLGLGTVLSVELRTVTLVFLASGETRTYSRQTAPLSRVLFAPGDRIRTHEGWSLKVDDVKEHDGLLTYTGSNDAGDSIDLPEGQLDSHLQLNRPAERLFTVRLTMTGGSNCATRHCNISTGWLIPNCAASPAGAPV